jgi:haloacetate dehalogenase
LRQTRTPFFDFYIRRLGLGVAPGRYPAQLMETYRRMLDDTTIVQAICEDYRAGATVDRDHDDADLGRRWIECPLLALWSAGGALPASTVTCSTCGDPGRLT